MYGIARIVETLYQNNVNNNDDSHPYIISYNMYLPDVFWISIFWIAVVISAK